MGYVGAMLIEESLRGEFVAVLFFLGVSAVAFTLMVVSTIFEGQSAILDRDGIEQTRFFYDGKFFVRGRVSWGDIVLFRQRHLNYRFKGEKFEASLNIASFNDEKEFVAFVQAHLPVETLAASLPRRLRPSKPNVVGRWVCLISTFLGGLWLIIDVRAHLSGIPVHIWGYALMAGSIAWAKRLIECSSVRLDAQGLEQLKVFDRGKCFVGRRLAWEEVVAASPFLTSCKFSGADFYIRVDASYFVENEEVVFFADRHLPANVFGQTRKARR